MRGKRGLYSRRFSNRSHRDETRFGGSKRLYPAPSEIGDDQDSPNPLIPMARREGFAREQSSLCEPTSAQSESTRLGHKMAEFEMARREGFASQ
jgi:hypothetical protein